MGSRVLEGPVKWRSEPRARNKKCARELLKMRAQKSCTFFSRAATKNLLRSRAEFRFAILCKNGIFLQKRVRAFCTGQCRARGQKCSERSFGRSAKRKIGKSAREFPRSREYFWQIAKYFCKFARAKRKIWAVPVLVGLEGVVPRGERGAITAAILGTRERDRKKFARVQKSCGGLRKISQFRERAVRNGPDQFRSIWRA